MFDGVYLSGKLPHFRSCTIYREKGFMPAEFTKVEIATLATYYVGADSSEVDTDDVAIKVNKLAPGHFSWRKHKEQIYIEIIRAPLSDAKKPENGSRLTGAEGWLLADDGLNFVKENIHQAKPAESVER